MTELVGRIVAAFESARDPAAAEPMARYMRHQFPFLGIPSPDRRRLLREVLGGVRPDRTALLADSDSLWTRQEREYQYAACDLLVGGATQLVPDDLAALAVLITTKSWWDTVDALATSVVGSMVAADRYTCDRVIDRWIASENLWLARTALLHQNKWKASTDEDRLFSFCLSRASDTDFFMRKAIGWALREYSKTAPNAVRGFVEEHVEELSPLSRREALKRLDT